MNCVFVSAEVYPFRTVAGKRVERLALALSRRGRGADTAVILPLYYAVSNGVRRRMRLVKRGYVAYGWRRIEAAVYRIRQDGVAYYMIECDRYFGRTRAEGYFDDGERFAFFAHAALAFLEEHLSGAELLIASGWGASQVIPVLKWGEGERSISPLCALIPDEDLWQGTFSASVASEILHLNSAPQAAIRGGYYSYLRGASLAADRVLCFSEEQRRALLHADGEGALRDKLRLLPPVSEPGAVLPFPPSRAAEEKRRYKREFCEKNGLGEADRLLVAVTEDLTESGAAILSRALPDALAAGIRVVFCGMGGTGEVERLLCAASFAGDRFLSIFSPDAERRREVLLAADAVLLLSEGEAEREDEALSYGALPILPSASVREGGYGYEQGGLSDALFCLHADYQRRGSLRGAAREAVRRAKERRRDAAEALLAAVTAEKGEYADV